jgi:hypothetical protein
VLVGINPITLGIELSSLDKGKSQKLVKTDPVHLSSWPCVPLSVVDSDIWRSAFLFSWWSPNLSLASWKTAVMK